jgi:hypothetical protein
MIPEESLLLEPQVKMAYPGQYYQRDDSKLNKYLHYILYYTILYIIIISQNTTKYQQKVIKK